MARTAHSRRRTAATRQDATIRNVRAFARRDSKISAHVRTVEDRLVLLEANLGRVISALRHLATV
jgi:hypothetical protein